MKPRQQIAVTLALTLSALTASDAATGGRLTTDEVAELTGLASEKRCGTVLDRVAELRERAAGDPDLLVAEGNCTLYLGRSLSRRFDAEGFENTAIALGRDAKKSDLRSGFFLTDVTYEQDAVEKAVRLFRQALEAAPHRHDLIVGNIALLVNVGRLDEAVALLESRGAVLDGSSIASIGQLVMDQVQRNRPERAERLARELTRVLPSSAVGPARLADVLLSRGEALGALEALEQSVSREPSNKALASVLIDLALTARRFDTAIGLLVPRAGDSLQNKFWFGIARERISPGSSREIWDELVEHVRTSERTDPVLARVVSHYARSSRPGNTPTPLMRLRAANEFIEDGILIPGIAQADHAVSDDPRLVEAWMLIAEAYRGRRLFDLALQALDQGIEATSGTSARPRGQSAYEAGEFMVERARVLMGLGHHEKAYAAFEDAAESGFPAKDHQALAALRCGRRDDALRLIRELAGSGGERSRWAQAKLEQLGEATEPAPADGPEGG